jgi:RNA 3'-terminal phosphate cyclase (ATP)
MSIELLPIDGSFGEGGGQILRTSLALSVITGRPFRIFNIRANRPKGGLRRQHLTCVRAAAAVCGAEVTGAEIDSREVTFVPGPLRAGDYAFDIGTAGSTMLVLQTVLPALMRAEGPSTLTLRGGTHNVGAPPFPFLHKTFLPLLGRMGPRVDLRLERAGFAPRGGGMARVGITPVARLKPLDLAGARGPVVRRRATATVAGLPRGIAERELKTLARLLELRPDTCRVEELPADQGPGNLVNVELESAELTEVFTAFGEKGVPAERLVRELAREVRAYEGHGAPVGEHLADQLLLPLALAGGGRYLTGPLSLHATTNVETIRKFLEVRIGTEMTGAGEDQTLVTVG